MAMFYPGQSTIPSAKASSNGKYQRSLRIIYRDLPRKQSTARQRGDDDEGHYDDASYCLRSWRLKGWRYEKRFTHHYLSIIEFWANHLLLRRKSSPNWRLSSIWVGSGPMR